jgi:nucleoside-diphosphate-sugar epimerase
MSEVLITGINGFIGSRYADLARSRGWVVIGSDIGPCDLFGKSNRYLSIDLAASTARDFIDALPSVDYILHAGGISGFMVASDDPDRIVRTNVAGTASILEFARVRRPRRVVVCSTIMAYGPDSEGSEIRRETEYPRPISVYGASKVAVEGLMHGFHGQYGIDAVALRFSHVYGPGRTTECFIREMMQAALEGRTCRIPQSSRSPRQYIHVDDVCRSIDLAMKAEAPRSRVFNISANEIHSLADVAEAVRSEFGEFDVIFDEGWDVPSYRVGRLSIERAGEELGYLPQLPLAKGLRAYWQASFTRAPA